MRDCVDSLYMRDCVDSLEMANKAKRPRLSNTIGSVANSADTSTLEIELCNWNKIVEFALTGSSSHVSEFNQLAPTSAWWRNWLWDTDPMESTTVTAPLNLCQLHGLLICKTLVIQGVLCGVPLGSVIKGKLLSYVTPFFICFNV